MGIERKAVVFYRNFYEAIKDLPVELRAEVYDAVMEYGLNGGEPEGLSLMAKSIFALIKPSIDTNNTRYENGCKSHGRPKKHPEQTETDIVKSEEKPNNNQNETQKEPTNNINNENENENINNIIIQEDKLPLEVAEVVVERVPYEKIVQQFNEILVPLLPKVAIISDTRKTAIKGIFNKHGTEAINTVFQKVRASSFLTGEQGWKCSFDWIFKPSNFIKILEGNYDDENRRPSNTKSDKRAANNGALQTFVAHREGRENMAGEVAKPF